MTTTRAHSNLAPLMITAALSSAAIGWDLTGLDMTAAAWFGGPAGFPLRNHWLFSAVLHEGGRLVSWGVVLWLCVSIWWPIGWLARITPAQRLRLVLSSLLAVLMVSGLKSVSLTSCPWDLAAFGRTARHVSHWSWGSGGDGAGGGCFPAGHASAGFAFIGGYFAFRSRAPAIARGWLCASLLAGALLGLGQQVRGAHFMSHTLWSACVCWLAALIVETLGRHRFSWKQTSAH